MENCEDDGHEDYQGHTFRRSGCRDCRRDNLVSHWYLKIPVSTTHTIAGSIMGVGATKRLSAVRWGVTKDLMIAWILTIPVSGLLGAGIYLVLSLFV